MFLLLNLIFLYIDYYFFGHKLCQNMNLVKIYRIFVLILFTGCVQDWCGVPYKLTKDQ